MSWTLAVRLGQFLNTHRGWAWGLGAVLALAFLVRLIGLNASLWYDEVYTLTHFVRLPFDQVVSTYSSLNNHPLYSIAAKIAVSIFGESAWALRLPAVLAGVAAIGLAGVLTRRFASPMTALLLCLLLAIAFHHVWFSQNARGYTMLLVWSTAASLLFLKGAEAPGRWTWPLYGVTFALAHYTHLSAAFFFAGHGAIYAFALVRRILTGKTMGALSGVQPFIGMAIGVVLTLLLYSPMLGAMGGTFEETRDTSETHDPLASWTDPAFVIGNIASQIASLGPMMGLMLPVGLAVAGVGGYVVARKSPLTFAIFILPIPITIVALSIVGMRIWPRYFFIEIQFFYMCVVLGVMALIAWATPRIALLRDKVPAEAPPILAGVAMVAVSLVMLQPNFRYPKQDLAGAVAYIESHATQGDVRASYGLANEPLSSLMAPGWATPKEPADLAQLASGAAPAWVVVAFTDQLKSGDPEAWRILNQEFDRAIELPGSMGDGYVLVFRSR